MMDKTEGFLDDIKEMMALSQDESQDRITRMAASVAVLQGTQMLLEVRLAALEGKPESTEDDMLLFGTRILKTDADGNTTRIDPKDFYRPHHIEDRGDDMPQEDEITGLRECVVCGCVHLSDELNLKDKEIERLKGGYQAIQAILILLLP